MSKTYLECSMCDEQIERENKVGLNLKYIKSL